MPLDILYTKDQIYTCYDCNEPLLQFKQDILPDTTMEWSQVKKLYIHPDPDNTVCPDCGCDYFLKLLMGV